MAIYKLYNTSIWFLWLSSGYWTLSTKVPNYYSRELSKEEQGSKLQNNLLINLLMFWTTISGSEQLFQVLNKPVARRTDTSREVKAEDDQAFLTRMQSLLANQKPR